MSLDKTLPKFRSEAEEAAWWDRNRERAADWLEEAAAEGKLTSMEKVAALPPRKAASKNIAIRVPVDDLQRARRLAARKGLRYQTLIKMLLHEGLDREERAGRKAGSASGRV